MIDQVEQVLGRQAYPGISGIQMTTPHPKPWEDGRATGVYNVLAPWLAQFTVRAMHTVSTGVWAGKWTRVALRDGADSLRTCIQLDRSGLLPRDSWHHCFSLCDRTSRPWTSTTPTSLCCHYYGAHYYIPRRRSAARLPVGVPAVALACLTAGSLAASILTPLPASPP
jgi:hypothetical protein